LNSICEQGELSGPEGGVLFHSGERHSGDQLAGGLLPQSGDQLAGGLLPQSGDQLAGGLLPQSGDR
jgi:hypothetical protein